MKVRVTKSFLLIVSFLSSQLIIMLFLEFIKLILVIFLFGKYWFILLHSASAAILVIKKWGSIYLPYYQYQKESYNYKNHNFY